MKPEKCISLKDGCFIEKYDFSKASFNPEPFIKEVASMSYGNTGDTIKNYKSLYEKLKKENEQGSSEIFEFVWFRLNTNNLDSKQLFECIKYGKVNSFSAIHKNMVSFDGFVNLRTAEKMGLLDKIIPVTFPYVHTFKIRTSLPIFGQLVRHRQASYNVLSRRRVELKDGDYYIPERIDNPEIRNLIKTMIQNNFRDYKHLLSNKIPKELARMFLQQNIFVDFWVQFRDEPDSLYNFLNLRTSELGGKHPQFEITEIAASIKSLIF